MPNDVRARREQMRRARATESDTARYARLARDRAIQIRARDGGLGQRGVQPARDLRPHKPQPWRSNQPFQTDSRNAPGHSSLNQQTKKRITMQSARQPQTPLEPLYSMPFCFSCEELFADRVWLEEHVCPAMTYICSCGTEFSDYADMTQHSTEHEPGQTVLHHDDIQRRRAQTQRKAQEQLRLFKLPAHSRQGPQAAAWPAPLSIAPWLSAPRAPSVPTMDLWALYQPVVMIETLRCFDKENPFQCGTCEQGFRSRNELIKHHSSHIQQRVISCLRCGMLLPPNKFGSGGSHVCRSSSSATVSNRVTTAPKAPFTTAPNVTTSPKIAITISPSLLNNRKPFAFENQIASPKAAQAHALLKHQLSENAADQTPWRGGYLCMMCQISFQSVHLLQRHKCVVAADYARRQAFLPNVKRLKGPYTFPPYVARGLGANRQVSREDAAHCDKAVGTERPRVKTEEDSDNDCYVIEDTSSQPSQLFRNPNVSPFPVIKT